MEKTRLAILIGGILVAIAISLVSFNQLVTPNFNTSINPSMEPELEMPLSSNAINFDNIRITEITAATATVEGTTDKAVNCQVEYGTNGFTASASDSMMRMDMPHKEHKVTVTGLTPDTTYNYRFKATLNGETFYSDAKTFTTMS